MPVYLTRELGINSDCCRLPSKFCSITKCAWIPGKLPAPKYCECLFDETITCPLADFYVIKEKEALFLRFLGTCWGVNCRYVCEGNSWEFCVWCWVYWPNTIIVHDLCTLVIQLQIVAIICSDMMLTSQCYSFFDLIENWWLGVIDSFYLLGAK